ncbi:hypothetical protein A2U01_0080847 [Trifolium medium]|uniref:Uncharacterized protein n=1 Tax=Trifolium medium TaxID=97028 RepID=A0A392TF75_9FABA|nr:hypothetical protein [Trifolium medium]
MLRKRKFETAMAGRVAHKSIETGNRTKAKGKDIAISLTIRPVDTAIEHTHRKGDIHLKDNTRL